MKLEYPAEPELPGADQDLLSRVRALDDLEGHEEECLEDFNRDLDAAFWEDWETAVHSTGLGHEEYQIRSQEEIQAGVNYIFDLINRTIPTDAQIEDGSAIPPVPGLKGVDWNARIGRMLALADEPPTISIPDKLYAKARQEGYEAGMADAALIAGRYLDKADAAVLRGGLADPVLRENALEHIK